MTEKQYDEEGRVIRENRSQAKREREHIKTFARELLKLPAHQYPLLPIDETLQAALVEGKRLSGNALSRHLNYLTRLLDEQDYEAIRTAHEHVNHPYLHSPGKQQRIRAEMERLLAGDADIYGELLGRYADLATPAPTGTRGTKTASGGGYRRRKHRPRHAEQIPAALAEIFAGIGAGL